MSLQMYSVRDTKGGIYNKPFFVKHVAEATRAVQSAFSLPTENQPWFAKYPADFALYFCGTFDESNGMFQPPSEGVPVWVVEVISLDPANQVPSTKKEAA